MTGKPPRTISDSLKEASLRLRPRRIRCDEERDIGRLEAEMLLSHALNRDRAWLLSHPSYQLLATSYKKFQTLVARRMKHEPIAYIIGRKWFFDNEFLTDKRALIPRPETELLVELALDRMRHEPSSHDLVWDVGTGCGAIAISIAKKISPRHVLATDVSIKAISLARKNAKRLGVSNVKFLKADLLSPSVRPLLSPFSPIYQPPTTNHKLTIVANLPYLPDSDKKKLQPDVVKYEPKGALFAGRSGMDLLEKFLRQLAAHDIHFSSVFLEFDPPQTMRLKRLAKELFPHAKIKIHKDLAKRDRVLEIS